MHAPLYMVQFYVFTRLVDVFRTARAVAMEAPHNTKRRRRNPIQQIVWNARGDKGACPENSVDVVKFSNCKVFRKGELVWEDVWVQDGIVIDPMKRFWEASDNTEFACDVVIDCQGQILGKKKSIYECLYMTTIVHCKSGFWEMQHPGSSICS